MIPSSLYKKTNSFPTESQNKPYSIDQKTLSAFSAFFDEGLNCIGKCKIRNEGTYPLQEKRVIVEFSAKKLAPSYWDDKEQFVSTLIKHFPMLFPEEIPEANLHKAIQSYTVSSIPLLQSDSQSPDIAFWKKAVLKADPGLWNDLGVVSLRILKDVNPPFFRKCSESEILSSALKEIHRVIGSPHPENIPYENVRQSLISSSIEFERKKSIDQFFQDFKNGLKTSQIWRDNHPHLQDKRQIVFIEYEDPKTKEKKKEVWESKF